MSPTSLERGFRLVRRLRDADADADADRWAEAALRLHLVAERVT